MNTRNRSESKNKQRTVDEIIDEIKKKAADGDYIFRGEAECYDKVSSNLYRELEVVKVKYSDINDVQNEIADAAKAYTDGTDAFEILTEFQHYGGKTNLIDFTTNSNVALFFACYGHPDKPGRVIVLQKTEAVKKMLKCPRGLVKRAIDQDSVFIQPPDGFIEPENDDIINIPKDLKLLILEHLRECPEREISPKTIYNDIHGFISSQNAYWMSYREFYDGLIWKDKGDEEKDPKEKQDAYREAITHYTNALERDSQQPAIYNNRGNAYGAMDEVDKAINDLNKAIELKPDYANAYNNRGDAYRKKGKFDNAIKDYDKAIELKLDFAEAYNNRGVAYNKKGEVDKAINNYNMAIQLNPDFAEAYNNRGRVYGDAGDFPKAISDYNKAITLKSDFVDAYINRGVAYAKKNDLDKAIEDFNTAINTDQYHVGAYYNRGNVYRLKGDFDKAIDDFTMLIRLEPPYLADVYRKRGSVYGIKRDFGKLIDDFTKAIQLKLDDVTVYYERGNAYLLKGDFDKAIDDYAMLIKLNPNHHLSYCYRGFAWLHLKEWDKARDDFTTAKNMEVDIVVAFHNTYRDISTFERRNDVKLPKDIVAMLMQYPINPFTTTQKVVTHDGEIRESAAVLELLEKFRNAGKPLHEHLQEHSSRGITTGYNEAFIVGRATRDALIAEHPSSADVLKPFLMARDIQRWRAKPTDESRREAQDKWLIFAHREIDINAYPVIKKYLGKYHDALKKRSGKQEWYELQTAPMDTVRFTQPKCIYADMASETAFAFDDEGYYVGSPASLLSTSDLWLLGVLNTRAVSWFYARTALQVRGPFLKFVPRYVSQIPIPDMESEQRALIHKIVEYILYLKKQPTVNSRDLKYARDSVMLGYFERIIDGMVYESYLPDELHKGRKHFFQPLLNEQLPPLEEIRGDKMSALRDIFERLYEKTYPVAVDLFFLSSVQSIRIIESKA